MMFLNSIYLNSSLIGVVGLAVFIFTIGLWIGKMYGGNFTVVNFLMGCFVLLCLNVIFVGIFIYLMVFSNLVVWVFLFSIPIACWLMEKHRKPAKNNVEKETFSALCSWSRLGSSRVAIVKLVFLLSAVSLGLGVAWIGRTGTAISHIGEAVSYSYWFILAFSFFMLYLVWREENLAVGLKIISMCAVAFLVFGAPLMVYSNYITEDSFGLLGVVKSIIHSGIYGWTPHLARSGYFAIPSLIAVSSSTQIYIQEIYKLLTPLAVSIYAPLFIYLILQRTTRKKPIFAALASIFLFPTVLFISIPIEKSIATLFFLGSLCFSFIILEKPVLRKAEIAALSLVLLAIPFLHDYFAIFAAIPLILAIFLKLFQKKKAKRFYLLSLITLGLTSLLIPASFVLGSYVTQSTTPTIFSFPDGNEVIKFLAPTLKLPISLDWGESIYSYTDNIMWVRYILFIFSFIVIAKTNVVRKRKDIATWFMLTILSFWVGYFLLRTSVQNAPESAKDYRFGFFVDLSLIPCTGMLLTYFMEKTRNTTVRLSLQRISLNLKSRRLFQVSTVTFMILLIVVSVFCGFNFDRIMERPIEAQGIGRYVVTDEKLQAMQYIQNVTGTRKNVVLSDAHMGNIAQGALDMNFEKAEIFNLNSGGVLYSYFNIMRQEPSRDIMNDLMVKTNAEIGFFVISLDDWRGWQSENAYWIDLNAIEGLKIIANDWREFGAESDLFVFVFEKS